MNIKIRVFVIANGDSYVKSLDDTLIETEDINQAQQYESEKDAYRAAKTASKIDHSIWFVETAYVTTVYE